jgi:hypothetical protein
MIKDLPRTTYGYFWEGNPCGRQELAFEERCAVPKYWEPFELRAVVLLDFGFRLELDLSAGIGNI